MKKKIVVRISNGLGNQMFMYASALALAKKLNRILLIDDETAFRRKQNIRTYGLFNFTISSEVATNNLKYLGFLGYLRRKLLIFLNNFVNKKKIYIESKNKEKITKFDPLIFKNNFSDTVFLEGHFESEKYFIDIKETIINEFKFKDIKKYQQSPYYKKITTQNSVSICLRQNRFSEGRHKEGEEEKSNKFSEEQIKYINKSIKYIKKNVENPVFFLWSNDLSKIDINHFAVDINRVNHDLNFCNNLDKRCLDLYLITKTKHHIVIPSTFSWWGAWLSEVDNKFITRPSENFFSDFKVNNVDYWPDNWIVIDK